MTDRDLGDARDIIDAWGADSGRHGRAAMLLAGLLAERDRMRAEVELLSSELAEKGEWVRAVIPVLATARQQVAAMEAERDRLRAAAMWTVDRADAWIADCCGTETRFCEQFGCGTLRELVDHLRAALLPPGEPT